MTRFVVPLVAAAALAVPAPALAAWTAPVTVDAAQDANPVAQGASGGTVLTGWLRPIISRATRSGDGFGPLAPITAADPFEKAWNAAETAGGEAIVLTMRKHKPTQRVRAIFVAADGTPSAPRTISDFHRSATGPQLSVAADGTAVAAWGWHDPAGWKVQAAVRRPGQPRFDKPQTLSPAAPVTGRTQTRPWIRVAAGVGGRAALTWQFGGNGTLPEAPLHVLTTGADGAFGADQALPDAGGLADVALAVSATGEVQLAYLGQHYGTNVGPTRLHVSQGAVGAPLSAPLVLSSGGKGTSSGPQVAAAFSADGSATVAWAKPGSRYEDGGDLEVFTRAAGGAFGPAQTLAQAVQGTVMAGGPGASAVLAWMQSTPGQHSISWAVHAATRPQAGGAFGAEQVISATDRNALWPSVAVTAAGDAIAAWVTNTDGSGGGQAAAAIHQAD